MDGPDYSKPSACEQHSGPMGLEDVEQSPQERLLAEIERQYEMRRDRYEQSGGNPDTMTGSMTCYLPFELLQEVFARRMITK